jgi:hypothetical protein
MKAERLYNKVMLEAEREEERRYETERLEVIRLNTKQPESKADQDIRRICQLRKKTGDIYYQLELDRRLRAEQDGYLKAAAELREANLTAAERRARAVETRKGQILFSKVCRELHPDWRQHAREEFLAKEL